MLRFYFSAYVFRHITSLIMALVMLVQIVSGGFTRVRYAYDGDNTLIRLGLSVTEGGLDNSVESLKVRYADYIDMGIRCIRLDTSWNTSVQGKWTISPTTVNMISLAGQYGLEVKAILPTIMAPPQWLQNIDGARLEDYNGRKSVNTVSYWYEGIVEYTDMALRAELDGLKSAGLLESISSFIVDMGPAGEPLYPPAWTQVQGGLDNGGGADVMWCYAENAQSDFRTKMTEKYININTANNEWGTSYNAFDDVTVPQPGETSGQFWSDVLTWYRDTKRTFMEKQIGVYKAALEDYGISDRYLILYLPGADFPEKEWDECVKNGTATNSVKVCCDNEAVVQLAEKYGCLLQYTGITGTDSLKILRKYMYANGYEDIPVFGENAGDASSAGNISGIYNNIREYGLWGVDYTHSRFLFESDGTTKSELYKCFYSVVDDIAAHLVTKDSLLKLR